MCVNSVVNADRGLGVEGPVRTAVCHIGFAEAQHYQCLRSLTG